MTPRLKNGLAFALVPEDVFLVRKRAGDSARLKGLLRRTSRPVWVIPESLPVRVERVLTVVDGSQLSSIAFGAAVEVARHCRLTEVTLVRTYFHESLADCDHCERKALWAAEEECCHLAASLNQTDLDVRPIAVPGPTLAKAVRRALERERPSLLVLASKHYTPAAAALFNGELETCVEEARVPVLVLKQTGPPTGILSALSNGTSTMQFG